MRPIKKIAIIKINDSKRQLLACVAQLWQKKKHEGTSSMRPKEKKSEMNKSDECLPH